MDLPGIEKFRDPIWRASQLYSIRERGGKVIPFRPRPQQSQVLHMIYRRGLKRIVILKARQTRVLDAAWRHLHGSALLDDRKAAFADRPHPGKRTAEVEDIIALAYDSFHANLRRDSW